MRHFLIALIALYLAACSRTPLQEQQAYVFGTRVEVVVASAEPAQGQRAIAAVLREFDRMHRDYHAWQPSGLTEVNQALAAGRSIEVSPEMATFLRDAQALSKQGDYLFDPGIGGLIALWGFHADEFVAQLPEKQAIEHWLAQHPSIADLHIDGQRVSSPNRALALDFGGYLKGVALDRAATILKAEGIRNALINIGGNVMALGSKDDRPWRVGIQHPRQPGPLAVVALADGEAIGTSGDYQRYFEIDGVRYAHLLDPRSGWPVTHTQAVTVLIPAGERAGTLSDATSKPIFVAGSAGWREMARQMQVGQVLRVDAAGKIEVTAALHARLENIAQDTGIFIVP